MIEVKLSLYTPWELAVIHEGMTIIHKAREAQVHVARVAEATAAVNETHAETLQNLVDTPPEVEQVIASITPEAVVVRKAVIEQAPAPKLEDIEAIALKHLTQHGLAKTSAVVASFGASQIKKVDESKWPAMLARLKSEVTEND